MHVIFSFSYFNKFLYKQAFFFLLNSLIFFLEGDTLCNAQSFTPDLCSGITPDNAEGTIWDAVDWIWVAYVYGKYRSCCAITLALYLLLLWIN